jgi:Ca-activated chloride channel family protein
MSTDAVFDLRVSHDLHQYLAQRTVHAHLTVTARGAAGASGPAVEGGQLAEVILLDDSGSMSSPRTKLHRAKEACCAAIDTLRDGTYFAVVGGAHTARMVYPRESFLAPATAVTRAEAKLAVHAIAPGHGRTIIGRWLDKARELLEPHADRSRHVLLLTDGQNTHQAESERSMATVLADCRGRFSCDALGIGADWEPAELRRIAEELHGTADAVPDLDELPGTFRRLVEAAMHRTQPEAALRVRCAPRVTVSLLEQSHPTLLDLLPHRIQLPGSPAADYHTGPWGTETRTYVLSLTVADGPLPSGADHRLASVEVVTGAIGSTAATPAGSPEPIDVRWLDQPAPVTELEPHRQRHEQERELYDLRWQGGTLYRAGDHAGACRAWGQAAALAATLNNDDALRRLRQVVVIEDAERGVVSLRSDLTIERVYYSMMGTVISSPDGVPARPVADPPAGPGASCPECGRIAVPGARFCESCGRRLPGAEAHG